MIAVESGVVWLARALTPADLANFVASSVVVTVTRLAEGESVVTTATSVALWEEKD